MEKKMDRTILENYQKKLAMLTDIPDNDRGLVNLTLEAVASVYFLQGITAGLQEALGSSRVQTITLRIFGFVNAIVRYLQGLFLYFDVEFSPTFVKLLYQSIEASQIGRETDSKGRKTAS